MSLFYFNYVLKFFTNVAIKNDNKQEKIILFIDEE